MLCRKIVSIILSKTFEIELSRFNMEGYTCHLNVVIFVSLHFGRTPSSQAWAKREKWKMLEIHCNWGQCLCNTVRLLQRRKAVWQVGGKKGGDEKPQEQEKRMTSPFCYSCELAPLCFMEIGIDEDTRVTKNRESSVMSSMYGHAGSISPDLKLIKTPVLRG